MRLALCTALCSLSALLPLTAVETPLVIAGQDAGETAIVNPGLGTLSLYLVEDQLLTRKGAVNFKADLEFFQKLVIIERGDIPWTALRTGSSYTNPPTLKLHGGNNAKGGDVLGTCFSDKVTPKEKEQGLKSMMERAIACEDQFWAAQRTYDGTVRAAFGRQYVMIAVPSLHALVVYEAIGDGWKLFAWRNYGPELLVPQGHNTTPIPSELVSELTSQVTDPARREGIENAFKGIGELPAGETPASQAWIGAANGTGGGDTFVLVDHANTRIALYQITGKSLELMSVRNYAVDLEIPKQMGEGIRAVPSERAMLAAYAKDKARMDWVRKFGIVVDRETCTALVNQATATKNSPLEAVVSGDHLIIDLPAQRTLLTYSLNNGSSITMISVRNYTVDAGLALLDQQFRDKANAAEALARARALAGAKAPKSALEMLRLALRLDPLLVEIVQKEEKGVFRDVAKQPDWKPLIDDALRDAQKMIEAARARAKAADEARKAKNQPEEPTPATPTE